MRPLLSLAAFALGVTASAAAAQDWRGAREYEVLLTSFDVQPDEIRLKAGEPVRLRLVNTSNQGHSFSAEAFFKGASMRKRDAGMVKGGQIVVPPLSTREVILVPKPGRYKATSGNFLHRLMGMSARIVVE
jgi:plastocyanin